MLLNVIQVCEKLFKGIKSVIKKILEIYHVISLKKEREKIKE